VCRKLKGGELLGKGPCECFRNWPMVSKVHWILLSLLAQQADKPFQADTSFSRNVTRFCVEVNSEYLRSLPLMLLSFLGSACRKPVACKASIGFSRRFIEERSVGVMVRGICPCLFSHSGKKLLSLS